MLKIKDVSKTFASGKQALNHVSLEVDTAQIVALLGKSGSGKSTLLRLVNGLEFADQGEVLSLGLDPKKLKRKALKNLRKRIGFIFQDLGLVDRLSVLENVLIGALGVLRFPRLGIFTYPKRQVDDARNLLSRVGLEDLALRRADSLSGGERQRLAVARCLMQSPELIVADEPVSSLDPETAAQVLELIASVSRERSVPVVISLHQPELAVRFADRVVGLKEGRITLDVDAANLKATDAESLYGPNN